MADAYNRKAGNKGDGWKHFALTAVVGALVTSKTTDQSFSYVNSCCSPGIWKRERISPTATDMRGDDCGELHAELRFPDLVGTTRSMKVRAIIRAVELDGWRIEKTYRNRTSQVFTSC